MGRRLLLADDEKGLVTMVKNYFELSGYEVLTAYNGSEAIEQAARCPDLILLDIAMPDMDGLAVCRQPVKSPCCSPNWKTAFLFWPAIMTKLLLSPTLQPLRRYGQTGRFFITRLKICFAMHSATLHQQQLSRPPMSLNILH